MNRGNLIQRGGAGRQGVRVYWLRPGGIGCTICSMLSLIRKLWRRRKWDRFTERARAAMVAANRKAHESQSPAITEEHLLAAIVEKGDGAGAALLRYVGVRLGNLRPAVVTMIPEAFRRQQDSQLLKLPMDRSLKNAVSRAIEGAMTLGSDYVGTEHLVLGLSGGGSAAFACELAACELTPDILEKSLRALTHQRSAMTAHIAGKWTQAVAEYRQTLKFKSDDRVAANNLAWLLATCPEDEVRSGNEALKLMEWVPSGALTLEWNYYGTLAVACAECGHFEDAIIWGKRALELAAGADEGRWEKWLAGFAARQPVRDGLKSEKQSDSRD